MEFYSNLRLIVLIDYTNGPLNIKRAWNSTECANFADISISMELHEISCQVHGIPWNSMKLGVSISLPRAVPWDCVEFGGSQFHCHEQLHGIPWKLECPISMTRAVPWNSRELRRIWGVPISLTRAVPWNSMEFRGIWCAPISLTPAIPGVPWNSTGLGVRQFRWH